MFQETEHILHYNVLLQTMQIHSNTLNSNFLSFFSSPEYYICSIIMLNMKEMWEVGLVCGECKREHIPHRDQKLLSWGAWGIIVKQCEMNMIQ